jgi:hypothetical protein
VTQKEFFPTVGGRSRKQGKAVTWDFGYRPDPAATEAFVAGLPRPTFAEAAPDCMAQADPSRDALLHQACVKVTGANLPAHKQSIGCCTSEGWSYGVDVRQCVDAALGGAVEYKPISHAVFYGLGRARAGMLGSGDGCFGSAMAEAATKDGCVTNEDARDSGTDDTLASEYGRRGVPAALKDLAAKHLCRTVTLVSSADECMAALQSGYPVPVCSGQGFTMTRDADGFCKARGSWAHCVLPDTLIAGPTFRRADGVRVGDVVYGHDGEAHAVKEVYRRDYRGPLVRLKATGLPAVCVTEEHPVLVYRRALRAHGTHRRARLAVGTSVAEIDARHAYVSHKRYEAAWVMAKDVRPGDYLTAPRLREGPPAVPAWVREAAPQAKNDLPTLTPSEDLAWLLGFYVGDGSAEAAHKVSFILSLNDPLERITGTLRQCFGLEPTVERHETFVRVHVYNAVLADSFLAWFGGGAEPKRIPDWLMTWDRRAVVDGLLQADGCRYKGGCRIVTTSKVLAHQVKLLLGAVGERPRLRLKPPAETAFANAQDQWEVDWCPGARKHEVRGEADFTLHKVRSAMLLPYEGPVFNYEVEGCHSYVADGAAVHNCMCIVAYRADKRGFLIVQSWGQNTPDGPCVLGQPDNSFWAEWATVDRMLKEKDSFAVSAFDGFPARTIPWSF